MRLYEVTPIPGVPTAAVLRHHDGAPAGRHLRLDLLDRLRRLPLPGAVPDEEAARGASRWPTGPAACWPSAPSPSGSPGSSREYAPLYTLYWPLPADFSQFSVWGGTFFIVGIALVMVGTVFFVVNIFKTITYTPPGWPKQPAGALLGSALGLSGLRGVLHERKKKEHLVSLPVAAIARGTVDTALNAGIILFTGVLILVYMIAAIFGHGPQAQRRRRPALQELVLVGPRPHRRRPRADLRGGHLVPAGHADHRQEALHGELRPRRAVRRAGGVLDRLVAPPDVRPGPAGDAEDGLGRDGDGLRADHAGPGLLHHAGHALERAAAEDDAPAQVPAGRPARLRAGGAGRHHAGRPRPEPHPPQHAVDHRPARARGRAGRPDDDALLGDLPAASRSSPTARSCTARSWPTSTSGRTCSAASAWAPSWAWRDCRACCAARST